MTPVERLEGLPDPVQGLIACDVLRDLRASPGVSFAELVRAALDRWEFCSEGMSAGEQAVAARALLSTRADWHRFAEGVVS